MADGVRADFSDLAKLVADLDRAPGKVASKLVGVVQVTAQGIEDDWKEPLKGSATIPAGAASISHDISGAASALLGKSAVSALIGPALGGQGAVVGMLETGTPNTGPRGFGLAALKKNEAKFLDGIGDATEAAF